MPDIEIDTAEFAGVVGEGILYGIYVMLVGFAGYLLVNRKRSGRDMHYPMVATVCLMFTLVTAQIIVDVCNIFVAFFHHETRAERIAYLNNTTERLFQAKHYVLIVMLVVGDSFVSYRCFIIWGKRWWTVAPSLLLSAASLTCGIVAMVQYDSSPLVTIPQESKWLTCLWTFSLGANALSTGLLAFKIWQVDRANKQLMDTSESPLIPILRIVVESGALNAAYLLIFNITLGAKTQGLETVAEMSTAVFGIIATLLIVRVQINTDREMRYTTRRPTTLQFRPGQVQLGMMTSSPDMDVENLKGYTDTHYMNTVSLTAEMMSSDAQR